MIEVINIAKYFGKNEILKDISLNISNSEIIVLSGPSGCGKTTLLRMIAGFEKPNKGKIFINNREVSTSNYLIEPHKRQLSMIFQDLALWPHMTVEKHIIFTLKAQKLPKETIKSKTDKILNSIKLDGYNRNYPFQLSGGEKQRLAIARALASNARYILMDEPFSSLDNILKKELYNLVIKLKQQYNMGILYVTHNIDEMYEISDKVILMKNGKIIQSGILDELIRNPINEFVQQILKRTL